MYAYIVSEKPCGPEAKIDGLPYFVASASDEVTSTMNGVKNAAIATSLISRGSIFLPRYSGVRPTISPPMNTASRTNISIEYRPVPTPPKTVSDSDRLRERHEPADAASATRSPR